MQNKALENLKKLKKINNSVALNLPANIRDSFRIDIKRIYTDTQGTVIDKNNVLIPDALKTDFPVYLFGCFDKDGGYFVGQKNIPAKKNTYFIFTSVYQNGFFDLFQLVGSGNIKEQLNIGDQLFLFTDNVYAPTVFCWIVLSCERLSYASILSNPVVNGIEIIKTKYFSDSLRQFNNSINFVSFDEIGRDKMDGISPLVFKDTDYEQDGFIDLDIRYNLNNYLGIYFYYLFTTNEISFIFEYKKPEPKEILKRKK